MNIREIRTLRNMLLIGGSVTLISFLSGLGSAKRNYYFNYPSGKKFKIQRVNSINDIEDLEFEKKCKFLFYKNGQSSSSGVSIQDARRFEEANKTEDNSQSKKILEQVNSLKDKCQEDSFVYINI